MNGPPAHLLYQQQQLAKKHRLDEGQQGHYRVYWDYSSYYSNKLRAYLNYKEIPYKLMQTTLEDYIVEIPKMVGMSIVPVVLTPDDQVMQDSTPIMEWFEQKYSDKAAIPDDRRLAWIMWLLEEFSDEYLVRLAMRTRWGTSTGQQTLSARISRGFLHGQPSEIARSISQSTLKRQSGFNKSFAIETEKDCQAVDDQFIDLVKILDEHLTHFSYLLGDRPSLADFAFFGPLWAHGFNDPWSAEILEVNAPQVCNWLQEMANIGDNRGHLGREDFGDWLNLKKPLPESLLKLVSFVARTYLPQALGYRGAMMRQSKSFTVNIYGIETTMPRFDYRAGTFAELQQRFVGLNSADKTWLGQALASTGLLPALLTDEVVPSPFFAQLTPPFINDPGQNRLAYKGK